VKLICVPPDLTPQLPAQVWDRVDRAVNRVRLSDAAGVHHDVLAGDALVWLVVDQDDKIVGAVVTQLQMCRGDRLCVILAYGADDHARAAPLLAELEAYARSEGCAAMRVYGRKGWTQRLPDYRITAIIMDKAL